MRDSARATVLPTERAADPGLRRAGVTFLVHLAVWVAIGIAHGVHNWVISRHTGRPAPMDLVVEGVTARSDR